MRAEAGRGRRQLNQISITNNGRGIPVVWHKDERMFVPELIFGTLLTSSNYDDSEKKVIGGRNGFGAKLCNIFSEQFTLETSFIENGKKFKQVGGVAGVGRPPQTWCRNMTERGEPEISTADSEDFTRVTFTPDLARFGMQRLDQDLVDLMSRRALDVAGTTRGVKVFLNGQQLVVSALWPAC